MSRRSLSRLPYQLRGVDALFEESSSLPITERCVERAAKGESLSLSQINLPHQQPRRYFDPQAMEKLIASIRQYGILQPLIVRPLEQEKYELVAGERRYRAAIDADLDSVPVVIRELNDEEALQMALLENLQREDLNPIEETESILQLLSWKLEQKPEEIILFLNQAAHPNRASVDNVIHTQNWNSVLEVFDLIGKFTPESFRTNRLPLLKLPKEVKEALRNGLLAYTKARAIAKVKDPEQRRALLEIAISEDLSLTQIQERIKNLELKKIEENEIELLKKQVNQALLRVKQSKAWEDPKKKRRLAKILAELESLI
jgi:ParB family chromosome partitioning protein